MHAQLLLASQRAPKHQTQAQNVNTAISAHVAASPCQVVVVLRAQDELVKSGVICATHGMRCHCPCGLRAKTHYSLQASQTPNPPQNHLGLPRAPIPTRAAETLVHAPHYMHTPSNQPLTHTTGPLCGYARCAVASCNDCPSSSLPGSAERSQEPGRCSSPSR